MLTQQQSTINHKIERDTGITDAWLRSIGITAISLQNLTDAKDVWLLLKAKRYYGYMCERDQALWLALWHHTYTLGKPLSTHNKNLFRNMFKRQDRQRRRK